MKIGFLSVLLIIMLSCSDKDLPKGILPENKMRSVLWDLMRADEWVAYQAATDTSLNKFTRSIELYHQVLQIHNIKPEEFKKSFQFYQNNPHQLKPILDSLQKQANTVISPSQSIQ